MRNAIIDNSTITAVQRLLGEVEIVNSAAIDGDIAAFEGLVQAILFYDNLFFIDDYKKQFRESRASRFSFLTPLSPDEIHYRSFMDAASEITSELGLRIRDGVVDKNEIGNFLQRVGVLATFRWEMQSSDFLLKMKLIEDTADREVFAAIQDMVFVESVSAKEAESAITVKNHYELLDQNGTPIPRRNRGGGESRVIPPQLSAFAGSINWLALRSVFYTYVAGTFDADAILHPIRSDFQATIGPKLGLQASTFSPLINMFAGEIGSVVKEITCLADPVVSQMDLPIFSAWLVQKVGDPRKIIDAAFELRGRDEFISLRRRLSELESLSKEPNAKEYLKDINKLVIDIKKAGDTLREVYGVKTKNGVSIAPLVIIINCLAKLKGIPSMPALPIKIKLPDRVLELGMRGGFKGVFRSVLSDLVAVRGLGNYHDKLTAAVVYRDGKKRPPILPAVQPQRYLGFSSRWSKRFNDR